MPHANGPVLTLDLRKHCIETAIRKRYERCISAYFKTKGGHRPIEQDIELLRLALETLDFPALRAKHSVLAGASSHHVQLSLDHERRLEIRIDGRPLPDLPQR